MTSAEAMRKKLLAAFRMPTAQGMANRRSSITNSFVNAVIPVIVPSVEEIEEALRILGMSHDDVRCAYCGDRSTEWDHLRPLVLNRRPTGYVSEIANLVPACGKCNQSKGNKPWREWMRSPARLSPTGRGLGGIDERMMRLEAYEGWKQPTRVGFASIIGDAEWDSYWSLCEAVNKDLTEAQKVADALRQRVMGSIVRR